MKKKKVRSTFFSLTRVVTGLSQEKIAREIEAHGLSIWFEESELIAGQSFSQLIEASLTRSRAVAVLVGPKGLSNYQRQEIDAVLSKKEHLVIPVLLPGAKFRDLKPRLIEYQTVDMRDGLTPEGIGQLVFGIGGWKMP